MGLFKFLRRTFRRPKTPTSAALVKNNHGVPRLSWEEIQKSTMNFSLIIGYGGFSTVYFAQFSNTATTAAVKIYCNSPRLYQAYQQELSILLRLRHDHIVKLLAHCSDREGGEEGVLVLEYTPNGNLQEALHGPNALLLPWKQRMAIAFQLAQALLYLHQDCYPQIVHGDIKASNILLDRNFNCKLCDFGSAKVGFSSVVGPPQSRMAIVGSPGYTDPLYLRTGIASKKNDVYSFGIVVLELITGLEPLELKERTAGRGLEVTEMVDPRLCGEVDLEEARAMAAIAAKCVSDCATLRPSASDISTEMMNSISSLTFLFQKKLD